MINKDLLKSIKKDLEDKLKELSGKYGVEIRSGGGTFNEVDATLKLKVTSAMKNSDEYLKKEWDKNCGFYGFKPEHFGMKAIYKGEEVQLIGFNHSKPKNCINFIKTNSGEKYMCSREAGHSIFKISGEADNITGFGRCGYCGNPNGGRDRDILCRECRETFGHSLFSEL